MIKKSKVNAENPEKFKERIYNLSKDRKPSIDSNRRN